MTTLPRRLARFAVAISAACVSVSSVARADVKDECNAAAEQAQRLRRDAQLRAAREQLLTCARPECPTIVRADCTTWLAEVDAATPSVVIHAVDAAGGDVADVRVSIDGVLLAKRLDGTEIRIDPGHHVLRFEHSGDAPVEQPALIRAGEKHRAISVVFANAKASSPPANVDSSASAGRSSLVLPIGLMGVGAAALGAAAYLWIDGRSAHSTMASGCAVSHNCSTDAVNRAKAELIAGDVAAAMGVSAAAVGLWMILTRGQASSVAPASATLVPGGALVDLHGTF